MRIQLLTVGKARQRGLAAAAEDYLDRLSHYVRIGERVVRDERTGKGVRPKDAIQREGERILGALPEDTYLIALDREGRGLSSEQLARKLDELSGSGKDVTFVIGGAFGLASSVFDRADMMLSLSTMTFPHELARLILLEQVYRAQTILRGEPYHK